SDTLIDELDRFTEEDRVGLVSIMDHTPGQRQFRDFDKYRAYVRGKHGMSEDQFQEHAQRLLDKGARVGAAHEAAAVAAARRLGAVLASHDDTLPEHVATSAGHGVRLAEFPTTPEAAQACRDHGIAVMMGAPNVIRGGSHSGNVAATDLAAAGLLDILSSDYVPAALMMAAFRLADLWGDVARGLATVTLAPARAAGLDDRGELAIGKRADIVRVHRDTGLDVVRGVWALGRQVA
ncbi:MAG: alpha-D-ribose 1-methylphosphonate 5-triphosphate diphosphatase, partial [Pseudomonadota bacterium]|nr:alpha-D-ribose 1-methylphosphonate 5-triphosphate diphosphatase [Pseudomonadota bacterium]